MRFLLITALLPLTASFASTPPEPEPEPEPEPKGLPKGLQPGGDVELTLSYKPSSGLTTRYKLSVPTHYSGLVSWPLLVGFHGWGGSGSTSLDAFHAHGKAAGYVVVASTRFRRNAARRPKPNANASPNPNQRTWLARSLTRWGWAAGIMRARPRRPGQRARPATTRTAPSPTTATPRAGANPQWLDSKNICAGTTPPYAETSHAHLYP
eukprot:scaffold15265_cov61-Phaeocystis_antarctica.AAC.2